METKLTPTREKIEKTFSNKVSEEKKQKLELFLINSNLDRDKKDELIELMRQFI